MDINFKTIHDFNDYFKDEETCYRFLETQRWNGIPVCPHCTTAKAPYVVKARGKFKDIPSYRCSERGCKLPFTVRTGSIYEGSKVELRKWFQAAYEISTSKKGISSVELATRIGLSQKTAWFLNHRIRTMLTETTPELLEGIVEADETFVGNKNKNRHASKKVANSQGRADVDKTAVVRMLQRNGKIKTCVVAETSAAILQNLMIKNVAPQARGYYRCLPVIQRLEKHFNKHISVKHTEGCYKTVGDDHTNNIESLWSQLKRGVIGIYHCVSPQHLHRYCAEFETRYNGRNEGNVIQFVELVKCSDKRRVRYKELTSTCPQH